VSVRLDFLKPQVDDDDSKPLKAAEPQLGHVLIRDKQFPP
jgi:hypothetical protein